MAEVHVIGELVGATGFSGSGLFCKWSVSHGSAWRVLEGCTDGQTQVDAPQDSSFYYWSHPLGGYGFCHLPTTPGSHRLECVTWRPRGSARDQLSSFFLGGAAQLKDSGTVVNATDRCHLHTVAAGNVHVNVAVLLRNFDKFGVETGQ